VPSRAPVGPDELKVVPANEAAWTDLTAIFSSGDASRCLCQRYKLLGWFWATTTREERAEMLAERTACDTPDAPATSGLVAYLDGEPVAWAAVEPRAAYPRLLESRSPVPWQDREEDPDDPGVWSVTCMLVRGGWRGRGITYLLAKAAIGFARERGATALEAYPMITEPGRRVTWGELHVGARQVFEEAGFAEVSHPTKRRAVMRIDFK
jgi:GNAT superfamily N-acetyltransferase